MNNVFQKLYYAELLKQNLVTRIHSKDNNVKIWYSYNPNDFSINSCMHNMKEVKRSERQKFALFVYEFCIEEKLPLILDFGTDDAFSLKAMNLRGKQKNYRRKNLSGNDLDKIIEKILAQENEVW